MTARFLCFPSLFMFVASACSTHSSGGPAHATGVDAQAELSDSSGGMADATDGATDVYPQAQLIGDGGSCDSAATCDGGDVVVGTMHLFELAGTVPSDSGPSAVTQLDAAAAFHVAVPDDYDDRQGGIGCTADHYDATAKPAPTDADAGWLRMSGFAGGTLLAGGQAAQPIVCSRSANYYGCAYPTGTTVSGAFFPDTDSPLGPGPVTFALPGAPDFGARAVSGSPPSGTATTAEDLNAIHYSSSVDTIFHVSCSESCTAGRIAVNLMARQASTANVGWPYPSVGIVRCVFAAAASIAIPHAATAAMFAEDSALDTVLTAVALLPTAPLTATDAMGNQLVAEVGRGTFGVAAR